MKLIYIVCASITFCNAHINDDIIQASFSGDATFLTNLAPQSFSDVQGILNDDVSLNAQQALQLGTLSRGYNIVGLKYDGAQLIYDPLYQQVKEVLQIKTPDVCNSLIAGYNILGRTLINHSSILYDPNFATCTTQEVDYLFQAQEYKAALFSLSLVMPQKSVLRSHSIAYLNNDQQIEKLIKICRTGDSIALKTLLSENADLCASLIANIENATIGLNKSDTMRLNCLEAAMLGTLERGYNVIGFAFSPDQGIILDTLFHDIISTLYENGVNIGILKIHLQQ